jgi:hypothetical protein
VTVDHDHRGWVAAAIARLDNIHTDRHTDGVEHGHPFLTATSRRGGMPALGKLAKMVDARTREVKRGTTIRMPLKNRQRDVILTL